MLAFRALRRVRALFSTKQHYSDLQLQPILQQPNPLLEVVKQQILRSSGELKFSRYWDVCLTHPEYGFYSQKNVFSKEGHFTTSPQISSMFGEMMGVWIMHCIQSLAKKYPDSRPNKTGTMNLRKFRLIQLGPGRGLLMGDILRCISQLDGLEFLQSLNMVEVSSENSQTQQKTILDELARKDLHFGYQYNAKEEEVFKGQNSGIELRWFKTLFDMLKYETFSTEEISGDHPPLTIVVAHEFFDALPTESLIYTEQGWKERVVRLNSDGQLVMVPSIHQLNSKFVPKVDNPELGMTLEVNHQSLMLMQSLAQVIKRTNGVILNVDYGNSFAHSNSIRAIRNHKYVPSPYWLQLPGMVDLSSYVDFAALQQFAQKVQGIKGFPPVPQGYFLQAMGINMRIEVLTKSKSQEVKDRIESDYQRLVSPQQMGDIYKVQMITRRDNTEIYPFLTGDGSEVF